MAAWSRPLLLWFQSLRLSKVLMRQSEKEKLHAVNAEECQLLQGRWLSDECMNAVMGFLSQKARL